MYKMAGGETMNNTTRWKESAIITLLHWPHELANRELKFNIAPLYSGRTATPNETNEH